MLLLTHTKMLMKGQGSALAFPRVKWRQVFFNRLQTLPCAGMHDII